MQPINSKKPRRFLMYVKFCMSRTIGYLSIVNSAMILLLLLDNFGVDVKTYAIPIYVVGFIGLFILGFIEVKFFQGQQEESMIAFERSPYSMEMFADQKEILRLTKLLEDKE